MPSWPMAMPSSTAMVLNSLAAPPRANGRLRQGLRHGLQLPDHRPPAVGEAQVVLLAVFPVLMEAAGGVAGAGALVFHEEDAGQAQPWRSRAPAFDQHGRPHD